MARCGVTQLLVSLAWLQMITSGQALGGRSTDEFGMDCNKRNTCTNSPSRNSTKMNCACTNSCTVFDDCCADAPTPDDGLTQSQRDVIRDLVTCMPVNYIASRAPIYIIKDCPRTYPDGYTRDRCEGFMDALPLNMANLQRDPYMFIPVTSTKTGLLYINVNCALCNDEDEYTFWNVRYVREHAGFDESVFENMVDLTEYIQVFPLDRIDMTHSTEMFHVCKEKLRVVDSCPDDWADDTVRELCEATALYVYQGSTVYRNVHCALCHGRTSSNVTCVDPLWQLGSSDIRPPAAFSLLLDFNGGGGEFISGRVGRSIPSNEVNCEQGHVWDPFQLRCIYLHCPEGELLVDGGCSSSTVDTDINTCPLIRLNFSDFTIDTGNMSVPAYNLTLAEGNYYLNLTHAFICAPSKLFDSVIKFDAAQGYLTIIGNVISIICLVIMLAVYSWYAILRNTPGIALMCLASALILGQLLFSIGIQGNGCHEFCYFVSLGIHFGFLAYFFWMNIVAFDIWNTFRSNLRDSSRSGRIRYKRFALYSLYAWGIPILIIVVSVILDQTAGNHVRPDYAVSLCFLNNRMGLFVLLVIPLALLLVLDIIFFVWTVTNIQRVSKGSKVARVNCPQTVQLSLFIKLAFVMGLTWIMGFVAAVTNVQALWYIFILLNSFQGVWIFISFVCTVKVLRLIKGSFRSSRGIKTSDKRSSISTRNTYLTTHHSDGAAQRLSTSRD